MNNFWRTWNAKCNKRTSVREICIDGNTAADKIADSFRQYYANIYVNSAEDKRKVEEFNKHCLYYVGDTNNISIKSNQTNYFIVRLKVDQLSLPHLGITKTEKIELKHKTDEQISPVNGLETGDQSNRQKQTKVEDKIF